MQITKKQVSDFLSRHAESVDISGYIVGPEEITSFFNDHFLGAHVDGSGFVVDLYGRLFMDGTHIGWLRREAGRETLENVSSKLGIQLPSLLDDFLK